MAQLVDLTDKQAEFVSDLIDWWLEGYQEAKNMTTDDRNLDIEELLDLMSGLDEQVQMCKDIREKLRVRTT